MKHKLLSGIMMGASAILALAPIANVSAATITPTPNSVTISRSVSGVSNPVTNTFTYTISADASNPSGATGEPTTASVVFNNVAPVSGTATKTGSVDFSGATYNTLGDYKYTLTETGSTNTTNYPLSNSEYTIYVSVRNVLASGVPTGAFEATLVMQDSTGAKPTQATFTNSASRTHIEISNSVTGNSADVNECFKYKVNIATGNGVSAGDTYTVSTSSTCSGNPDEITAGTDTYIYLKHEDAITIGSNNGTDQLPIGAGYSVIEEDATDYETYIDGSTTNSKGPATKTTVATDDSSYSSSNVTTFVNNKEIDPKTGVMLSILPFALIAILGTIGAFYVVKTKKANQ